MRTDRLLEDVEVVSVRGRLDEVEVGSVEYDSRQTGPGALFCCIPGSRSDGHDHALEAVSRGAVAVLAERALEVEVPQAIVATGRVRESMARAAATFHGHPARSLLMVGVTGTNGKTTVTHLLAAVFEAHGAPTTVIGTLGGARTTPEAPVLQRLLAEARESGQRTAALEVSSHALTQHRVDGIRFDAAVFTNLGHDHLDHHGTIERYFDAKASLFSSDRARLGVVRADDPWGERLIERSEIEIVRYALEDASSVDATSHRTSFRWRGHDVRLPLAGAFQVPNALAAATTASALGVPDDVIVVGLSNAKPVRGRFEVVEVEAPFSVVVDYAHTPEGLEVAIASARHIAGARRVITVFGAGGDRDREKRPAMGAAASRGSDLVFVTSDNPRGEDPEAIVAEVVAGIAPSEGVVCELDRGRAIELAIGRAEPGDVVLIAGKGHETDIETRGRRTAFDDRVVAAAAARRIWSRRMGTRSGS